VESANADLEVRRQPKLAINESVISVELDGETVLLNVESGVYFGLDSVGTAIWRCLAEGCDENDLCNRLLDEFEIELPVLRADVADFLAELRANGLLQPAE